VWRARRECVWAMTAVMHTREMLDIRR